MIESRYENMFINEMRNKKGIFLLSLIFSVVLALITVSGSVLIGYLLESLEAGAELSVLITITVVYIVLYIFFYSGSKYVNNNLLLNVRGDLEKKVTSYFIQSEENSVSKVQNVLTQEIEVIINSYFNKILSLVVVVFQFIIAFVYGINISVWITVSMIGIVILSFFINKIFAKNLSENVQEVQNQNKNINKIVSGVISSTTDINVYNANSFAKNLFEKNITSRINAIDKNNKYIIFVSSINAFISLFLQYGAFVAALVLVSMGKISIGETFTIVMLLQYLVGPLNNLLEVKNSMDSTKAIREEFETFEEGYEQQKDIEKLETVKNTFDIEEIKLNNLKFGYDDTKMILNNINVVFEKGKKYLILGKSGSGKSTIFKLLLKQREVDDNNILINNVDINKISKKEMYENIAYVRQDVKLIPINIYENVALSKEYNKEDIDEILKNVNLEHLEAKYDTDITENQNNLSGGEIQKILLARLLYHNKKLLMFDEFTSALDAVNAYELEKYILQIPDKTILNITHKYNKELFSMYDELIILKNGELIYQGDTHLDEREIVEFLEEL